MWQFKWNLCFCIQCFQEDPAPTGAPAGTLLQIAGCIPAYPSRGKGAFGPLLSALVGARKRETPTSNLTESTGVIFHFERLNIHLFLHFVYCLLINLIRVVLFNTFFQSISSVTLQLFKKQKLWKKKNIINIILSCRMTWLSQVLLFKIIFLSFPWSKI